MTVFVETKSVIKSRLHCTSGEKTRQPLNANKNKKEGWAKNTRWNTLIYNDLVRLHYYFSVSQVTQVAATTDYQDFSSAGCTCGVHLVTILGLSILMFDRKYFSPWSISNCIIFHSCPYLYGADKPNSVKKKWSKWKASIYQKFFLLVLHLLQNEIVYNDQI